MINCIVVTYGNLGKELISISEKITGKRGKIQFIESSNDFSNESLKNRIENRINLSKSNERVLVLIDIFASPHSQVLIELKERVKIIGGINLSMVIAAQKALAQGETDIENMANEIIKQTTDSIIDIDESA